MTRKALHPGDQLGSRRVARSVATYRELVEEYATYGDLTRQIVQMEQCGFATHG